MTGQQPGANSAGASASHMPLSGIRVFDMTRVMAGSFATALLRGECTGEGAYIDIAMFDTLHSLLPTSHAQYFYGGTIPRRVGNRHALSTPFGGYKTADGHAVIAVLSEPQFARFAKTIGHRGHEIAERFASDTARTENEPALRHLIEGWTGSRATRDVVAILSDAGIPAAPILDIAEATDSEHAKARDLVRPLPHPVLGQAATICQPVCFDSVKFEAASSAPRLGGQSGEILSRLCGLSQAEIDALAASGVIGAGEGDE